MPGKRNKTKQNLTNQPKETADFQSNYNIKTKTIQTKVAKNEI